MVYLTSFSVFLEILFHPHPTLKLNFVPVNQLINKFWPKSAVMNTGGFIGDHLGEYIPAWDTWKLVPAALVYTSVVAYSGHTLVGTA